MRKARAPLWWYQYRYGTFRWTWKATAIVVLIVGYNAYRTYEWSLGVPVCRRNADTVASMQAQQMGPADKPWQWRVTRCQDGWTDIRTPAARGHHD